MKIKKIKKMANQKYRIELENGTKFTTYDEVILKHQLLFHKEIDGKEYEQLLKETTAYDNYYKAVKQIQTKLRSRGEILNYLRKLALSEEEQEKILNELEEKGLLNEERYVRAFIADHIYLNKDGPYKIKKALLEHQIEENLIDDVLASYDVSLFLDHLCQRIEKRSLQNKSSKFSFEQKMRTEMNLLGYSSEMIEQALKKVVVVSQISKDGEKIRKRLEKKYQGNDLIFQLKGKLYQKGYGSEEINAYIEEGIQL